MLLAVETGDLVRQRLQGRFEFRDAGRMGLLRDANEILGKLRVLLEEGAVDDQRIAIRIETDFFQFSEPRSPPNSFSSISCEL